MSEHYLSGQRHVCGSKNFLEVENLLGCRSNVYKRLRYTRAKEGFTLYLNSRMKMRQAGLIGRKEIKRECKCHPLPGAKD